jgi:hypothetical protein
MDDKTKPLMIPKFVFSLPRQPLAGRVSMSLMSFNFMSFPKTVYSQVLMPV